ncbi:MAG TPA: ribulose-phosphate 3-epimerase [Candidatus Marinimicrobia bacterium]|jgi:ribulose-phosphate 3-epimerase|nr:ribulose-phosphate 3-epimerase [Candidatus Neomarinimicrobiota bacterium]MBQ33894.1 ribulose-phosphate 3-epimerase [Candidatus Neomarinimicrobiota bacterium]MDP6143626.1 ribulose-phosphate 3-epimerase [Candidatus Neomarinimicrobiota bacterium]MDP6262009.1 ribulose-phosphate 3-epimerase [Candidatus Neomarinimicrobiota bacterium]MDP7126059.1 ribulose-phosphate 3-epimerase [Candidatus Neomarinimicrobiota bacterium]|tara:strand:- start:12833 stop:13504 length:672 start_codon:yes stop_codon:yes gene_type:complete
MAKNPIKIAPSILSADFSRLYSALDICEKGGAEYIHVDVMDNHFVPNLTIGPIVVKSIKPLTKIFMDVHLMVERPEDLIKPFADAGADGITFHVESAENPGLVIDLIRSANKQIGISLKPQTPFSMIEPFLDQIDLLLIMSVEPGFGGQEYIPGSTKRIEEIHQRLIVLGLRNRILMEIDGGIKLTNAKKVANAGADILVAGSAIFQSENPIETIQNFKEITA